MYVPSNLKICAHIYVVIFSTKLLNYGCIKPKNIYVIYLKAVTIITTTNCVEKTVNIFVIK